MHTVPRTLAFLALASATFGCRALRNHDDKPAGAGPNKLLDDVAVGQNRCPNEDGEARPFVVERDATDLATTAA